MRVLFLTTVFPNPAQPTRGTFNRALMDAMAATDEVRVVAPISWREGIRRKAAAVMSDDGSVSHPVYYYPPGILRAAYGWFLWQSVRRAVARVVESFRPEAILAYWAHPDGEVALRIGRALGVPVGQIVGGSDVLLLARRGARRRQIIGVLEGVDCVFTVGSHLRDEVVKMGVSPERVHALAKGVDAARFFPGDRSAARLRLDLPGSVPILLWVGNMVPVKGLPVLLAACALLLQRGVDFRLCLVGDGPLRKSLTAQVRDLGLGDRVAFVGPVLQERLPDWYRAANLTVLSSYSEGIPNVLTESLACGTPFVATRVGGIAEIAADGAGDLVAAGDAEALASAMARGLARPPATALPSVRRSWSDSAAEIVRELRRRSVERSLRPPS